MEMKKETKCKCCDEKITKDSVFFFHSACCNAHFEGIIYTDIAGHQAHLVVCEKCGKFSGVIDTEYGCDAELQAKITKQVKK
jgi:hypothetical protein